MKELPKILLFILLAPFYIGMAFFLEKTYKWWSDLGNFS
jgi:hypothetical protein